MPEGVGPSRGAEASSAHSSAAPPTAARPEVRLGVEYDADEQQPMPEDLVSRLSRVEDHEGSGGGGGAGGARVAIPFSPFGRGYRGIRRALLRPPHHPGVMRAYVKRAKTMTTPRYDLYLELGGYRLYCMSASKVALGHGLGLGVANPNPSEPQPSPNPTLTPPS